MKFRFHLLGFPHTATNQEYNACAYTQKIVKFMKMMASRGHTIIHYGNEGSVVPEGVEHVQILTESERASWFGPHDRQKPYWLEWVGTAPYWQLFNQRAAPEVVKRAKARDFILTLAGGDCHQFIGDQFAGSYGGIADKVMMVEYGIGYYGTFSRYRVFESNSHREWVHGAKNSKMDDFTDTVIPNYFDLDDFVLPGRSESLPNDPYYLFVGRIIPDKGWQVAVEATAQIGAKLILAGQGDPGPLPPHVTFWGHATVEERAQLMTHAVACFAPTHYREPFGGVAVEAQLCGSPCITSECGAFTETVDAEWRCATHMEFCTAALRAKELTNQERRNIRTRAQERYSLEAVAPLYERYFSRLYSLWGRGYYEIRSLDLI